MAAALNNFAAVDNQDQVSGQDGAKTVGNDDAGAVCHDPLEGLLNKGLGFAVQNGWWLHPAPGCAGSLRMTRARAMRCFSPPLSR